MSDVVDERIFEHWPFICRDVGLVIRSALGSGARASVDVDVRQFGVWHLRKVEHRAGRGWVTLDYPSDPVGEDILYEGGDLFDAAFTAIVGRPPRDDQRATPQRVFQAMQVTGVA